MEMIRRENYEELWARYIALKTKCELLERKVGKYETWIGESSLANPINETLNNPKYSESVIFLRDVVDQMREICKGQEDT